MRQVLQINYLIEYSLLLRKGVAGAAATCKDGGNAIRDMKMTNQQAAKDWHPSMKTALESAGVDKGATRAEILRTAEQAVTVDRAATHGNAEDGFGLIATYWSAHLDADVSATDVAVMMGLLKIARIKANPKHLDSWTDVCGYAACGGEIATGDGA